jgi:signal transduction histidine kinase
MGGVIGLRSAAKTFQIQIMSDKKKSHIPGLNLDLIVDHLPSYVSIQDRSLRILYVNESFKRDFGDATGKRCHAVYKGSPKICPNCPVRKTFQDKQIHTAEETIRLSSGKICQIFIQAAPILDGNGDVTAVIEMATNISRVKIDRKELITLGQSIALLSHGIKNILEGLQGGAYVVDQAFKDGDLELAQRGWGIVNKNIFDITDVVQNILYSSKNRPLKYESVRPGELLEDSVQLFREKAAAMDIKLEQQINPTLPRVRLDAASIRRMLHNLLWNALEACHNDKEKNEHTVIAKSDRFDKDHFMFEISDNGIGMDKATQRNVLEEFFSTKGSAGTGLGLAVVDKVVNKHGGRIEVASEPGKGSSFKTIFNLTKKDK